MIGPIVTALSLAVVIFTATAQAQSRPRAVDRGVRDELTASLTVDAGTVIRQIPSTLYGSNLEWVWDAYSLWDETSSSADPSLTQFARNAGVSTLRYPGGMYADFYHWQDGIGPVQMRPVVPFQVSGAASGRVTFGTDEALQFAQQVGAELMITVNVGTGTAAEAADWVRYVDAQGLRVRFWEVGNEVYINDGLSTQDVVQMDPQTYASRFLEFARAMRAVDPNIKIGAVGGQNRDSYDIVAYPDWDQIVLQTASDQIDFLAVHNSYAPVNVNDSDQVRDVYAALLAAPSLIAGNLNTLAQQIATYAPSRASQIAIAVTEWGPLFQMTTSGRFAQHTRTLGSGIFTADMLKTFIESSTTQLANFNVFNDLSIMCWICSEGGAYPPVWTPTAEYMAFQMYRQHFGTQLISSLVIGPQYDSPAIGTIPAITGTPYLDVVSSLSNDGKSLYLIAINKHFDASIDVNVSLEGFSPAATALSWTLTGTGIDANTGTSPLQVPGVYWAAQAEDPLNPQFQNGSPGQVNVSATSLTAGKEFEYTFPPHSVTALQLSVSQP